MESSSANDVQISSRLPWKKKSRAKTALKKKMLSRKKKTYPEALLALPPREFSTIATLHESKREKGKRRKKKRNEEPQRGPLVQLSSTLRYIYK